ncbi:MAG: cytochrome c4 [Gammaproteobacteria bacterium]|nr:cytochrome c4 [Gammaproteobacteria bacterium]MCI0591249.1 cytochrome c4 [Gammaproteobacteria bacterium]
MKPFLAITVLFITVAMGPLEAPGDPTAGKTRSATCAACHGADGNSTHPDWPKLAGQSAQYLMKQLSDYKAGARSDPLMSALAAPLTDADIADLVNFYALQTRTVGSATPALVASGERIYRGGNRGTGIPACMACHGPRGAGNPTAAVPALGGQHAAYTAKQLRAFKSGERANDPNSMMRMIAERMSDEEIEAVADYISGLH